MTSNSYQLVGNMIECISSTHNNVDAADNVALCEKNIYKPK